jgi:hypothetical protein
VTLLYVFAHLNDETYNYMKFFRNFAGALGRNTECYADVMRPKLSRASKATER